MLQKCFRKSPSNSKVFGNLLLFRNTERNWLCSSTKSDGLMMIASGNSSRTAFSPSPWRTWVQMLYAIWHSLHDVLCIIRVLVYIQDLTGCLPERHHNLSECLSCVCWFTLATKEIILVSLLKSHFTYIAFSSWGFIWLQVLIPKICN